MKLAHYMGRDPTVDGTIEWISRCLSTSGFTAVEGVLVRTPQSVAFVPSRRSHSASGIGWSIPRSEVIAVRRRSRWTMPVTGFLRRNRIVIESSSGARTVAMGNPDAALRALAA